LQLDVYTISFDPRLGGEEMYASINIKMPKWDSDMREGKITRWFIKEGETHAG
jgi:hypothetical protein